MVPRATRALLLLSITLLLAPTGRATAQLEQAGAVKGFLFAGDAETCAQGSTGGIPVTVSHERCVGGQFRQASLAFVATRGIEAFDGRDPRLAACGSGNPDLAVPFATRENTVEGRGRIGPISVNLGPGTVVDADPGVMSTGSCTVRVEGAFHRTGVTASGRLFLDVHVDAADARQFRHTYCAEFKASAIPVFGAGGFEVLVVAKFEGLICHADEGEDFRFPVSIDSHGRTPFDDIDPLHHDECSAPPSDLLGDRGARCYLGLGH